MNIVGIIFQILISVVWANFIEYAIHRWFMHRPGAAHLQHHVHPEAWTLLLKWDIWALFAVHAAVIGLFLDRWVIVLTLVVYMASLEILHVAAHAYRWRHHMIHHGYEKRHFNICLPLFDLLLGTLR